MGIAHFGGGRGVALADTDRGGGGYSLTQLLAPADPNGPYGTYAYSLSGYSNVLTTFQGGDAIIGLHGANRTDLLGTGEPSRPQWRP